MISQKATNSYKLVDDRGIWVVRVNVIDPYTGQKKTASKSTGLKVKDGTKRQAAKLMPEIAKQIIEQHSPTVLKSTTKFKVYLEEWLKDKDETVRANTAKSYRDYAKVHIFPALGEYMVKDITWRDLQRLQDKVKKGHTNSTVKKVFIPIRGALDDAVRDGAIPTNPALLVKRLPKEQKTETTRALSKDEMVEVFAAAEKSGEPLNTAVRLALICGLRRSEVLGLRWIDLNFKKKTLSVRNTVTQNGNVLLDEEHTKTRGSRRTIKLTDSMLSHLEALRDTQLKNGLLLDKVVAWPDGSPVRPDGITRMFQTMIRNAGIEKVRFHDLRHTAATVLANAGASPKDLQAFLGHDDIEMTLGIYVHTDENAADNIASMMDGVLETLENRSGNRSGCQILAFGE